MKYYKIDLSFDTEVVGHFPQIEYFYTEKYNQNKATSFQQLSSEHFPNILPDLNCFFLNKKAKLTNIISSSTLKKSIGLFTDEKFIKLIDKKHLGKYIQVYDLKLDKAYQAQDFIPLKFIHFICNYSVLDYQKTTILDILTDEEIVVGSEAKFKTAFFDENVTTIFDPQKYVLNSPIDLVRLPMSIHIHISEKFKSILEENEITGIEFKPTDKVVLG